MHHRIMASVSLCFSLAALISTATGSEPAVPNGSLEQGNGAQPEAWTWGNTPETMNAEWMEGTAHGGSRAIRVQVPGEVGPGTAWSLSCDVPIPVIAGKEYIASFWLKAACDRPVRLSVSGYHEGKRVKRSLVQVLGFGPCDWTQFEAGFTVPQGVSSVRLSFGGKLGSDLLLDDVAIRPGHLAYSPKGTRVRVHLKHHADEKLDRGLVAVRKPEGVYVGWRLLRDDPQDIAFHVERKGEDGRFVRASAPPIVDTTDFLDTAPEAKEAAGYRLCEVHNGKPCELAICPVEDCEPEAAYRAIQLQWPDGQPVSDVEKVGIGDLDGDGRYDFVLKHPPGRILLWDDYTKWNRSPTTYKIDAFTADGKHLWRRDLGWGIEHRNWHSPMIVHDFNGDGRAEVAVKIADGDLRNERGRVVDGPEWVAVWDGLTGKEIARAPWPSRAGFDSYNFASRHQLAVAYLDGRTPCLIVLRGTYRLMKVSAFALVGSQLRPLWAFCNANAPSKFVGQGAHFTQCVDVDADGRDEVALGSMVLDDTGVPLWSTGKGHPDGLFVGDIDPLRPGLEVYCYVETRNSTGGMILVDAATGETLWELQTPTTHVHGGLCADLDPDFPGSECFGVDKRQVDRSEQIVGSWLKTATGKPLPTPTDWGFGKMTIYWDADAQKELIFGRSVRKYQGTGEWSIPRFSFVPVDLMGDWREELLEFTDAGELRIHLSTVSAKDRRVCLMQDPIYRRDIAMCAMGYHRPAMLSYCPAVAPDSRKDAEGPK